MKYNNNKQKDSGTKRDYHITAPRVLVIKDNEKLGVLDTRQAISMARELELNLIEVAPSAKPPVCIIADYGKWLYEKQKKQKKQKSSALPLKEIRLSPTIDTHDLEVKANSIIGFLKDGHNVLVLLKFYGRHNAHTDEGFKIFEKLIDLVKEFGKPESKPSVQSSTLSMKLTPHKTI